MVCIARTMCSGMGKRARHVVGAIQAQDRYTSQQRALCTSNGTRCGLAQQGPTVVHWLLQYYICHGVIIMHSLGSYIREAPPFKFVGMHGWQCGC